MVNNKAVGQHREVLCHSAMQAMRDVDQAGDRLQHHGHDDAEDHLKTVHRNSVMIMKILSSGPKDLYITSTQAYDL